MSELGGATLFKSDAHTDFPSVAAEGGCVAVRCVNSLIGPAGGRHKASSGLLFQRGPRIIRAGTRRQGDGGLRPRFTHWAERSPMSYCCRTSTARARLERARLGGGVASGLVAGTYLTIGTIRRRMTWPRRPRLGHCTAFPVDSTRSACSPLPQGPVLPRKTYRRLWYQRAGGLGFRGRFSSRRY